MSTMRESWSGTLLLSRMGILLFAFLTLAGMGAESSIADDFFEAKIRPLLVEHCLECHGGERAEGGLSLDDRQGWQKGGDSGPAIVPGDPSISLLVQRIRGDEEDLRMPPADVSEPLASHEIDAFVQWIADGAEDPRSGEEKLGGMSLDESERWWAFQPIPTLDTSDLGRSIDSFLDEVIQEKQVDSVPRADKRTLIRRATYDLTGLPPTPEAVRAFLADDSPESFSNLVERLLASPEYGRHWGKHWLDVVRYADTAGENTDRPLPHAWRYRNWVIDAFNSDLPFDRFVRMQIAGDLLPTDLATAITEVDQRNAGIIATGYLAIARRFGHDINKDIHLTIEDIIDNVGKNFLGLTLGCARCHDHKYDPVTDEDYYALYGVFASTKYSFPGCEPQGQPRDLVPLRLTSEQQSQQDQWQRTYDEYVRAKEAFERQLQVHTAEIQKALASNRLRLAENQVGESQSVAFPGSSDDRPLTIDMKAGEGLLLTVLANANHGADSTLVEWTIKEVVDGSEARPARKWSTEDLLDSLTRDNPRTNEDGSTWSFLQVSDEVRFLTEHADSINGASELSKWSIGDTPSVFVNRSEGPVSVWTQLPGRSFFVHPGPSSSVAVMWTSPIDCEVEITGRVADAHPAGLDGVAFQIDHLRSTALGESLRAIQRIDVDIPSEPAGPPPSPVAYAVFEGEAHDVSQHLRGDPEKLGDVIPRRWLTLFGGQPLGDTRSSGRLELAQRVATHPLAARVFVNRIWQWHFGEGLVRTPNDFGARGDRPTHPELLDWLAGQFITSRYSLKAMHRLIMNSEAYQRSSRAPEENIQADPTNLWLSRFSRRRLTAEELRDSVLLCSEKLDVTAGEAHPFPPESSWTFTQHNPFSAIYETDRRSVYLMIARQRRDPFLSLFDGADPNASTPKRQTTTVPTQALYFLNNEFIHANSLAIAERMNSIDEPERLRWLTAVFYQREPSDVERRVLGKLIEDYPSGSIDRLASVVRVLLSSNEFLYVD